MNILAGLKSIQTTAIKEDEERRGGSVPLRKESRKKRRIEIVVLAKKSARTVKDLVLIFGVHPSVIRHDLAALEKEGLIKNISDGRRKLIIAI